jgi:hypothetical protein
MYMVVLGGCTIGSVHLHLYGQRMASALRETFLQHVVGTVACLMENKILIEICYLAH